MHQEDITLRLAERLAEDFLAHATQIVAELVAQHFSVDPPALTLEVLPLASCGLMGDDRVYGYAWGINGVRDFDSLATRGFLQDAGRRLTNEVRHADGTRFVRVFVHVAQAEKEASER